MHLCPQLCPLQHAVPGAPVQLGNLPWVAHNLWWQYRCE